MLQNGIALLAFDHEFQFLICYVSAPATVFGAGIESFKIASFRAPYWDFCSALTPAIFSSTPSLHVPLPMSTRHRSAPFTRTDVRAYYLLCLRHLIFIAHTEFRFANRFLLTFSGVSSPGKCCRMALRFWPSTTNSSSSSVTSLRRRLSLALALNLLR